MVSCALQKSRLFKNLCCILSIFILFYLLRVKQFIHQLTIVIQDCLKNKLECGPMPNVMAALPNTGGALCSTPHSLADAHNQCRAVTLPIRETH